MSLPVKTPKFRCIGKIYSSLSKTAVIPTEIASCPIPENHLDTFPWRISFNIFSSISLGLRILLYKSNKVASDKFFLSKFIFLRFLNVLKSIKK